jgi:activator of HSP90 ATPase
MKCPAITRRNFAARAVSLAPWCFWRTTFAAPILSTEDSPSDGVSRTSESIHQEVVFKAAPDRVYEALMDQQQFSKMTGMEAQISHDAGGTFTCFGSRIQGRNIELVPSKRVVQAWRSEGWAPGQYSIARFELKAEGTGTRIVFDHTGFPNGQADHLAGGWKSHYWDSLRKCCD